MRFLLVIMLFISAQAMGNVTLPKIFGDHMVLQRDQKIAIWGWADTNEKISVAFNKQTKSTVAGKDGKWSVSLDAEKAGGPFLLTITGNNQVVLKNILIGDVWICSGQSNMEWPLYDTENAAEEINAANYPMIRHFKVPRTIASTPQDDIKESSWKVCSPATAAEFTAVGYYFAKQLTQELNIPIGLINTSWGGTNSETWTSREAFDGSAEFKTMIAGARTLDLDSIGNAKKEKLSQALIQFQGKEETPETVARWKDPHFDDSAWRKLYVPALWTDPLLGSLDGVVWQRNTFTLSSIPSQDGTLSLSKIDDSDETFVNGVKVGEMKSKYNQMRIYQVPAAVLKQGSNVVAVRVEDTGGGGGIYGDPEDIKLTIGTTTISLAGEWATQIEKAQTNATISPNEYPSLLYNAMINPLTSFSIKGVIWYQGESNASRAYQYRTAFPLMINDWRTKWKRSDLPFYFVQLSSYEENRGNSQTGSTWAELREAQSMTCSLPNTAMAVTIDIGNPTDIHPRNKKDVGKRLAMQALKKSYGKQVVAEGPIYKSMKIENKKISVSFSSVGSGLVVKGEKLHGFEVAGANGKFYPAEAVVSGSDVIVSNAAVDAPLHVRYGWSDDASGCNLFNKEGFPAGPFRTDHFKGITEENKYQIGF